MQCARIGNWELDKTRGNLIFNETSFHILGNFLNSKKVSLDDFIVIFHDLHQQLLAENIANLINKNQSFEVELSLKNKEEANRDLHWIRFTGQVLDISGASIKIGGLIEDISDFKLDHTKLVNYWNVLDHSNMISIASVSGHITYVNDNLLNLTGFRKDDLIGQTHSIFNSGFHPKVFFKNLWETILSGHVWSGEILNRSKNGKLQWTKTEIFPVLDFEGNIVEYVTIRKDINELKKQEQKNLIDERMKSITDVTNQIIHEIMSPLSVLNTRIEFIEDAVLKNDLEKARKHIDSLKKSSERVSEIFKDMRSLLREDQIDLSVLNLKDILRKVFYETHLKLEQYQISYSSEFESNIPQALGNEGYLTQILVNLVNNACDEIKNKDDRWIMLKCYSEQDYIIVDVIDSGEGISSELADKIFEYLFTTKKNDGGTGLGLALARRMITKMNGKLELVKGLKNTCFRLYLPKMV